MVTGKKIPKRKLRGKGYLDIIDEAVHILRRLPASVLCLYYIGSFPFVLGFLYFWSDMSKSAFAYQHAASAACFLSLLFLWMKCWQSVFCSRLLTFLNKRQDRPRSMRSIIHLAVSQTVLHASGIIILPLAFITALPFGWAYAFYQNVSVYGDNESDTLGDVYQRALRHATDAPGQNHVILLVLSVFGFFVFMNIWLFIYQLPHGFKIITGIETMFTKSGWIMLFNTTYLAVSIGIAYLMVDPLIKAVYTLRCFHGESVQTGEDLRVQLSRFRGHFAALTVVSISLLVILGTAFTAYAADSQDSTVSMSSGQYQIAPGEIERSIADVITKPEFSWRMPREAVSAEGESGLIASFINTISDAVTSWLAPVWEWLKEALEWITDKLSLDRDQRSLLDSSRINSAKLLIFVLIALVSCLLIVQIWKVWTRNKRRDADKTEETVPLIPALEDEEICADDLPVSSWLDLAGELIAQGNMRSGLRALYLASLSHLAGLQLITISKSKSNRDYKRELTRNAHSMPELLSSFSENVLLFDRSWYGMHEVSGDVLRMFQKNQEQIMRCHEK